MNPDFSHVRTDALHRFPVVRVLALLDKMKLKTGSLFNLLRKRGKCFVTIADPEQLLHNVKYIQIDIFYKYYLL
jgi:hypothetical protein